MQADTTGPPSDDHMQRLQILSVSPMPASPPRFGAQARIHGLTSALAAHHDVTAIALCDPEFDADEARRAMSAYCRDVHIVTNPSGAEGSTKRSLQLRSLVSPQSFESLRLASPAWRDQVARVLAARRFDVVHVEFPYLARLPVRIAPGGEREPIVVVDSHEIAHDLARQFAQQGVSLVRRLYGRANWPKLKRDELMAYALADGVCVCSRADEERLRRDLPNADVAVIPNAADVDYFAPMPDVTTASPPTIVFFGLLTTVPNIDGVTHFVQDIWPRIRARHPDMRLQIVGKNPPPAIRALAGDNIEVTGFVEDLRPILARATAVAVPLRLGGGTRLKIVEAMAMGCPIVSTALGAEGITCRDGRDILIADTPVAFANAVGRLVDEPDTRRRLGAAARQLAVAHYSWAGTARDLGDFYRKLLERRT